MARPPVVVVPGGLSTKGSSSNVAVDPSALINFILSRREDKAAKAKAQTDIENLLPVFRALVGTKPSEEPAVGLGTGTPSTSFDDVASEDLITGAREGFAPDIQAVPDDLLTAVLGTKAGREKVRTAAVSEFVPDKPSEFDVLLDKLPPDRRDDAILVRAGLFEKPLKDARVSDAVFNVGREIGVPEERLFNETITTDDMIAIKKRITEDEEASARFGRDSSFKEKMDFIKTTLVTEFAEEDEKGKEEKLTAAKIKENKLELARDDFRKTFKLSPIDAIIQDSLGDGSRDLEGESPEARRKRKADRDKEKAELKAELDEE